MAKMIKVYETFDGKRFATDKEALEHELDACGALIDARLSIAENAIGHSGRFKVVMALSPSASSLVKLAEEILRVFRHGQEDELEEN